MATPPTEKVDLRKYAWLSIAAAVLTIGIKSTAYFMTGSVTLLSDALESLVNLVAAISALIALTLAGRPADSRYTYGRSKAEYFSAGIEGAMIFVAATLIIVSGVNRLMNPSPVQNLGIGILISVVAGLLNGGVALVLYRAGQKNNSPTLIADAKHLFTDLITSVGVVVGVALVWLTGWEVLDPIFAIILGINIVIMGVRLLRDSSAGLMDVTLPDEENQKIVEILKRNSDHPGIAFHGLQTRQAGRDRFINVDLQVPGSWTVTRAHKLADDIEDQIRAELGIAETVIHIEPIEDELSYQDIPEGYIPIEGMESSAPVDPKTGEPLVALR